MKKLLTLTLSLFCLSAFAHSTDPDQEVNIWKFSQKGSQAIQLQKRYPKKYGNLVLDNTSRNVIQSMSSDYERRSGQRIYLKEIVIVNDTVTEAHFNDGGASSLGSMFKIYIQQRKFCERNLETFEFENCVQQ